MRRSASCGAKKPVVACYRQELGASAACSTAIATDRVFAQRLSIVASIGVLFETYNAGKLLDTIGIGSDKVAHSGPLKAEPSLDHPMTPEVRASLQSLVETFLFVVRRHRRRAPRPDPRAQVLPLADGRIMTGNQGLQSKLIDEIGGEAEAIDWLEKTKGIKADLPVNTGLSRRRSRPGAKPRQMAACSAARRCCGAGPAGRQADRA